MGGNFARDFVAERERKAIRSFRSFRKVFGTYPYRADEVRKLLRMLLEIKEVSCGKSLQPMGVIETQ